MNALCKIARAGAVSVISVDRYGLLANVGDRDVGNRLQEGQLILLEMITEDSSFV